MAKRDGSALYMLISNDKYELPLCVADSPRELAIACGVPPGSVYSTMSRAKRQRKWCKYIKVDISDI